ncbi:mal, T cell differentiation protein [Phyllostomus discolor]|uniref:Myelin and lymphocyte protein n=1 Tax=Phyllostomus discolor TaxID=89673 RepID=A0A834A7W8_9CHIR|nr:mal, T cell differentiation protein [Phyllostomus discolor]
MAPAAASGGSSLPSGFSVFTTFPDLLFILEFVFGGLVWILIASSLVPLPLMQGWVMFVSVFCFVATTTLLVLYVMGAHGGEASWITLVSPNLRCPRGWAVLGPLPQETAFSHAGRGCPVDVSHPCSKSKLARPSAPSYPSTQGSLCPGGHEEAQADGYCLTLAGPTLFSLA